MLVAIIAVTKGYTEDPREYEAQGVSHVDYEADQMSMKISPGAAKVKRNARNEQPSEYESKSVRHIFNENNQTPAEDRNWQVKPKVKRMSSKPGRKVHIYLKNEDSKNVKPKKRPSTSSTTTVATSSTESKEDSSSIENVSSETESQTRKTPPELTTKADRDIRLLKYADKDTIAAESTHSKQLADPSDSHSESSDNSEHVIKEKIKIKHHHHHHHHNHVKTVVKKEPYAVEKIVHVPVEKIVEKKVPYKVEVQVEKIVEKVEAKALSFNFLKAQFNFFFFIDCSRSKAIPL